MFNSVTVENYAKERKAALGNFMGTVIAGIYEGILNDAYNVSSDYATASGRPHKSILSIIKAFKNNS